MQVSPIDDIKLTCSVGNQKIGVGDCISWRYPFPSACRYGTAFNVEPTCQLGGDPYI